MKGEIFHLPNSRPAGPQDFSAFLSPQTLLLMIGAEEICGVFRGVAWQISRATTGKWLLRTTIEGEDSQSGFPSLSECFQSVHVTGIRLGKDD